MAINLGYQTIHVMIYLDGKLERTYHERRVVYEKKDGTFQINHINSSKKTVTKLNDGEYIHKWYTKTIGKTHIADLLKGKTQ